MTNTHEAAIKELCSMSHTNEAGQHWTEYVEHFDTMEEEGWIVIERPVHEATGIEMDQRFWKFEITDEGMAVVEANPEYHG